MDEVPAYEPCGEGEHLFVRFRKRGLDTRKAIRLLADAMGVDARGAGWAGLKDRHAVTTQWASFFGATPEAARAVSIPDVTVLAAVPHRHKLRVGHLSANRFILTIRGAGTHAERARAILERLVRDGVPNYYGEQRFGREGQNVPRARAWLVEGGRAPRDRFERKLLVSALQSSLFNEVLGARLRDGLFTSPVPGDLMRRESSGGLFVADDLEELRQRMAAWDVSPTGPMFGPKMRWPDGEARVREEEVLAASKLPLARLGRLGEGTRRPLRARLDGLETEVHGSDLRLAFSLPPGAYATAVTRELLAG